MRRASKALILLIAIVGSSVVYAADGDSVNLTVGRSTVVDTGTSITRVSLTSPDIADALVTSSNELLINGKNPGTISMFVWDRTGAIHKYEINVQRDLARLSDQLKQLFPGEKIVAHSSGKSIVLSGEVTAESVIEKAKNVAAGYVDKKDEVVSLLQVLPSGASNQVLLKVRFAEVSRNAMSQLGASWFSDGYKNTVGSITTGQFPAPFFDANKAMVGDVVFSDYLNLFVFDLKHQLGAVVKALQSRGLFQSLAEPNLVAQSGKEASFLAGGEFPIPVAQASGSNIAISIQFKEFGIRLNFTPTIVGDRIQMHIRPEVSTLDFNNAILLQGFRIPALSSRRAETDVELQSGQTFAIAGLLNNTVASSLQKIPGIGDIPILGNLFKSRVANKEQTELVVMITPEIIARNSSGVTSTLPRISEPFLAPTPQNRSMEMPPPAFRRPSSGASNQTPAAKPAAANADPAAAAATVTALTPGSVPVVNAPAPEVAPSTTATRPLTKEEQAEVERLKKQQNQQNTKQSAAAQRKAEEEMRRQAAANKEAKEAANKRASEAAKRQAEAARKQAERDRQQQKAIQEAAAKMKAAQAAYDAEVAKTKKQ